VDVRKGKDDDPDPKLNSLLPWVKRQRQKMWDENTGGDGAETEDDNNFNNDSNDNGKHGSNNGLAPDQRQRLLDIGLTPLAPVTYLDEATNTTAAAAASSTQTATGEEDASQDEDLGAPNYLTMNGRQQRWETNFELLRKFKEEHGDCKYIFNILHNKKTGILTIIFEIFVGLILFINLNIYFCRQRGVVEGRFGHHALRFVGGLGQESTEKDARQEFHLEYQTATTIVGFGNHGASYSGKE
jgi:hypothetical protein